MKPRPPDIYFIRELGSRSGTAWVCYSLKDARKTKRECERVCNLGALRREPKRVFGIFVALRIV